MSIEQRVRMCRMIEKMERNKPYCERLEIENVSTFQKRRADENREQESKS